MDPYYNQAEGFAIKANELAADAREKYIIFKNLTAKIKKWDEIMEHNPMIIFSIIFVIVAIGEYFVSVDLYIDLLPRLPWIIPLAIIGISVVFSHWLAYKFIAGFKLIEFDNKRNNSLYDNQTDEQIKGEINRRSNQNFYAGLFAAIIIAIFIFFMSKERVVRELAAGMRLNTFGFYDSLPVLFYIAEIITGVYIIHLGKRISTALKARKAKKQFDGLIKKVVAATHQAVDNFEKTESRGFDLLKNTISESIHIAFFRNKYRNPSDEEAYVAEPENIPLKVKFRIVRSDNTKPLLATVHLFSEYNYSSTGVTDDGGYLETTFTSFENDTIKKMVIEFSDGINAEDTVIYRTGNEEPHRVLIRQ